MELTPSLKDSILENVSCMEKIFGRPLTPEEFRYTVVLIIDIREDLASKGLLNTS